MVEFDSKKPHSTQIMTYLPALIKKTALFARFYQYLWREIES
jgi:hypothetical protein